MSRSGWVAPGWVALGAAALLGAAAGRAEAAVWTDVYSMSGPWKVEVWGDEKAFLCSATIARATVPEYQASFLRIEFDGGRWRLLSDYPAGKSGARPVLVDGTAYPVRFVQDSDAIYAVLDGTGLLDAMAAGRQLDLNLAPGQTFSLSGAAGAIQGVKDCARGQGLQNVGQPGVNDYGGYDIAGTPGAEERPYATVRGWTVVGGTVGGHFGYCAGEIDDRGTPWRIGWDGMQWQVGLPGQAKLDDMGDLEGAVDGRSHRFSANLGNGWTFLWLGMDEPDMIRNGGRLRVDLGGTPVEHPLVGTAAVMTKIEECVQRQGVPPGQRTAGTKGAGKDALGCPDDGPRLPYTGICQGRAINYFPQYGDYDARNQPDPACDWVVNEVQVVEDALLYRALRCKGVTAQLEYAGGAHWAQLMVKRSAIAAAYGDNPEPADPPPLVWFNWIDPANVAHDLDMRSRLGFEQEIGSHLCAIMPADPATSPDGYAFDVTPADPAYWEQREGPTPPLCGPFSEGDGVVRFWRVLGDYAFLFDLSADIYQDIDPNSLTLLKKDPKGGWLAVQPPPRLQLTGWVPGSGGAVDPKAVPAGREANGEPLYACATAYEGGLQPGKLRPGFRGCNFAYGGKEYVGGAYRTLTGVGRWVTPEVEGPIPDHAVRGGNEADGRPLYLCRGEYKGGVHPGKLGPSARGCAISYGGKELTLPTYEVLID